MRRMVAAIAVLLGVTLLAATSSRAGESDESEKKGGCCSHHKGACGCWKQRIFCCDKSFSACSC